jgi:hypothetical protein
MDEAKLFHKLGLLEALYAGAATEGEKTAAGEAKKRILKRLKELEREDPPQEFQFSTKDHWSRKVLVALLRRYGIKPYRYHRQRHTTVMAKMSKRFLDETLWPEYQEFNRVLKDYLNEVTERVVTQVLESDGSDAEVQEQDQRLLSK